jgi:hypothetical protein
MEVDKAGIKEKPKARLTSCDKENSEATVLGHLQRMN